jgi:hypothetical protein
MPSNQSREINQEYNVVQRRRYIVHDALKNMELAANIIYSESPFYVDTDRPSEELPVQNTPVSQEPMTLVQSQDVHIDEIRRRIEEINLERGH